MQRKYYKLYEGYIEFNSTQRKKSTERQKTSFPKESVKNADLFKSVLNKIMTTLE